LRTDKLISDGIGKLPPQAIDLEEVTLGALMIEKDALIEVMDFLKPESFYKDAHREIFKAIQKLFGNSEPIDLRTVANQLRKDGKLESIGGSFYLAGLTSKVSSSANIQHHARIVNERMIRREIIRVCGNGIGKAYEDTNDGLELLGELEQDLLDVSENNIKNDFVDARTLYREAMNDLEERRKSDGRMTGVPSGFNAIDKITSGWQNSDLIIIAARPGMGKTAFILNALRNAAVDFGYPVGVFSLEMSAKQLMNRLISSDSEIDGTRINRGSIADYEFEQIVHKTSQIPEAPIFIDDTAAISILELRAKARRLKIKHGIKVLFVDYLQLMKGNSKGNREQEISNISQGLKQVAKELDIPVIALSQLSRAVETRGGEKIPMLSDLRESGSIEQDADMVSFLYRPEYYGITELEDGTPAAGVAEFIIAKYRGGSLGAIRIKFVGKFTKFLNVEEYSHFDKTGVPEETYKFPGAGSIQDFEEAPY